MATCREIIARAYQMMGIVPLGEQPEATEAATALSVLQSIFDDIADNRDYFIFDEEGSVIATPDSRITGATLVQLPDLVTDEITREVLPPRDLSFVQYDIGAGFVTFVSDRGTWIAIDGLTLDTEAPLSNRGREGLSAHLATYLAESYPGAAIGGMTGMKGRNWLAMWSRDEALRQPEYF